MTNQMTEIPIYPQVQQEIKYGMTGLGPADSSLDAIRIVTKSRIRKKHTDGLYYLIELHSAVQLANMKSLVEDTLAHQKQFNHKAYNILMLYIIDPAHDNLCALDENQTPEEERLKQLIKI